MENDWEWLGTVGNYEKWVTILGIDEEWVGIGYKWWRKGGNNKEFFGMVKNVKKW